MTIEFKKIKNEMEKEKGVMTRAKLQTIKQIEKELNKVVDGLKIRKNANFWDELSNEQVSWNKALERLEQRLSEITLEKKKNEKTKNIKNN
jgi:hypothetical protein